MVAAIGMPLMLGGCFNMTNKNASKSKTAKQGSNVRLEDYVRVQDYTGQGFKLRNGEETDKIAKAHRKEIDRAVKEFFLKKYKTNVIVHNVAGNVDGATVFVESIGEPHFHTYAIVPIDIKNKQIMTDHVWSQDGQIENDVITGIYGMIYEKEFAKLDQYLELFTQKHPVVGKRIEAVNNVRAGGFSTPFYYLNSPLDHACDVLFSMYIENPIRSKEEWKTLFNKNHFNMREFTISIELYMSEPNIEPDPSILNQLVEDIEKMDGIPPGSYAIYLNDNTIDKTTGINSKRSTLERADPNYIFKQ